jgi:hypothetical protein
MSIFAFLLALLLGLGAGTGGSVAADASSDSTTGAQANVKQIVNAVESCAASRIDGSYGPRNENGDDCLDPKTIQSYESSLQELAIGTGMPKPGSYQLAPIGSNGMGYLVQANVDGTYVAELHYPDGQLSKVCGAQPASAATTPVDSQDWDC